MSKVILDFPSNFDGEEYLLDANFNFYQLSSDLPGVFVFVELYVASKEAVKQIPYGTPSLNHNDAFFFEARNYNNIGGGLITFERHFVQTTDFKFVEVDDTYLFVRDSLLGGGETVSRTIFDVTKQGFDFFRNISVTSFVDPAIQFYVDLIGRFPTQESNVLTVQYEITETLQTERANPQIRNFFIFSQSLKYDGATPFNQLGEIGRRKSIAARLEFLHAQSALLNISKGFLLQTDGPNQASPPLSLTRSTRYNKDYRLQLGTEAFVIDGETFLLWDGTRPVFSEV